MCKTVVATCHRCDLCDHMGVRGRRREPGRALGSAAAGGLRCIFLHLSLPAWLLATYLIYVCSLTVGVVDAWVAGTDMCGS
jgi:hypothetical protein